MHPGYMGTDRLLDAPLPMAADGLCLYHCILAAADYTGYMELSEPERASRAEQLRRKTILLMEEHGLSSQAARLGLSGYDGYPDEEDFLYVAMASGVSFEIEGISKGYVPHYGTRPISARVLFRKVADGAGHLSDHYDLVQIYSSGHVGNGRWRLWRKTDPSQSVWGSVDRPPMPDQGDVKIGNLWKHKATITAAIAKYPTKRARALSTKLELEYGLVVKWKALQTYVLREDLWTTKRPKPSSSMPSSSTSSSAVVASASAVNPTDGASRTIVEAKIGDLPRHRDTILAAIRANPGKKAKKLSSILASGYGLRVQWDALRVYIDREGLYGDAAAAPSTPMRGTGAPSTPTAAPMQAAPFRASPRRRVYAKLADLGRYKHRIIEAITVSYTHLTLPTKRIV